MKRAGLSFIILTLITLPAIADARRTPPTGARCASLEHVAGGWRMAVKCDQSEGAILLVDAGTHAQYIGEGMFKSWSQSEMMALYQSLLPKVDASFEVMQLG